MKKPAPASQKPPPRVTLKQIAKTARVSVMTVSYALRGSSEVSLRQRERIRKLAAKLGYRPDPLLTHLMAHLRTGRSTPQTSENLALLSTYAPPYVQQLTAGAAARANELGYALDRIDLSHPPDKATLTRSLLARGIAGLILTPANAPGPCCHLLDWTQFSTTAIGYSFTDLAANRVVTHHFENARRTFALLHERGFRRIGLAMTPDMEFRTNHSYSGAYCRLGPIDGLTALPVLILDGENRRLAVPRWFARWKPDALVLANSNHFHESIRPNIPRSVLRKIAFACLDYSPADAIAGIDQCFEQIGAKAVDDVVNQILRGERGLRPSPTATMLTGQWREDGGLYPSLAANNNKTPARP